jgi:hypothetical protein
VSGTYRDSRALVRQMLPLANELTVTFYRRVYELSREITLSHDATGMQHELLHNFMQSLSHNGDHKYTRNTLQSLLIHIRDIRRSPMHAQTVLPFTYHEVLVLLRLAEITHFQVIYSIQSGPSRLITQSPMVADAQMRPRRSPQIYAVRHPPPSHPSRDTIICELYIDRFKFPYHDAAWCPLLHDEKIRDKEVRKRVMQFRIQHKIKQDPLPGTLKQPRSVPPRARLTVPTANAAIVTDLTQDPHQGDEYMLPTPADENPVQDIAEVDSSTFDYPWPAMVNSATNLSPPGDTSISDTFEYRSLQE